MRTRRLIAALGGLLTSALPFHWAAAASAFHFPTPAERAATDAASAAERNRELRLLGITAMQPGATAYDIGKPGNANYDEASANPYPKLPALLVMSDGRKVTTPAEWAIRRSEIQAMFAEDVYGKYPTNIPPVTWKLGDVRRVTVAGVPAIVRHISGHADNSGDPAITVDIEADVVTPASLQGKRVPIIIGGAALHPFHFVARASAPGAIVHRIAMPKHPPDEAKLLLEAGWGFVDRNLTQVQADNGAGLSKGIIGLVDHGQPRSLDAWGVLRAWAWADSRILDYLETDPDVDGTQVGIMGHSRGGKEALVAMADDPRFAIGYISSSGKGGAALYRRDYGETLGNLCGVEEFHWFAGNFLRYCAAGHSADEMPVDSHEFIALIAPRPVFIGGGVLITSPQYVPGDAWQDTRGMFMAEAAASPAWRLLGFRGLATTKFPPMGTLIDSGRLAFRQHQYGHTPAPNWPYFIEFAKKQFGGEPAQTSQSTPQAKGPPVTLTAPAWQSGTYWINFDHELLVDFSDLAHFHAADQQLGTPAAGTPRVVFIGDSITEGWKLEKSFPGKPYVNRGISGQTSAQILLRFRQDAIDLDPKVVVILAGTNDLAENTGPATLPQIEGNLESMADLARANRIAVVLCSVLPSVHYWWHAELPDPAARIAALNQWLKAYAAREHYVYVDYYAAMKDAAGGLPHNLSPDGVHPSAAGYAVMASLVQAGIDNALNQRADEASGRSRGDFAARPPRGR